MLHNIPRGEFDRVIDIYRSVDTKSDFSGEVLKSIELLYQNVWARIEFGGGPEDESNDKTTAFSRLDITIPYLTGIDSTLRIVFENEKYHVVSAITELGRRQYLKFTCRRSDSE